MKWTPREEALIEEFSHLGCEKCAELLKEELGVTRTPEAIRRHSYRIGAPTVRYEVCPECGRKVAKLSNRTGLCAACNSDYLYRRQIELNTRLRKEVESNANSKEATQKERAYNALRKRNYLLRKSMAS